MPPPPTHADRIAVDGGAAPDADRLAALQVTHEANIVAARVGGLNAGVFAATVPPTRAARAPTAVARCASRPWWTVASSTLAACG